MQSTESVFRRPLSRSLARFSSIAAICAAISVATVQGADLQWDPDLDGNNGTFGGTGTWNTGTAAWWDGSALIAWPNTAINTDKAIFGGTAGTVTLAGPLNANALEFNVDGYTITNGGTAANTLTLTGTAPQITVANGAHTATISATIAGSTDWTKSGAGTLAINVTNTNSGRFTINGGTVAVLSFGNLGTGPLTVDGGTIAFSPTAQTDTGTGQIITIGTNGAVFDLKTTSKLLIDTTGALIGSGTLTRNASAGATGTFQVSIANTGFTGAVVLNAGVNEVATNGYGTGVTAGNTVTLNGNAELAVSNGTMSNPVILNGGTIGGDNGTSTYAGPITVNGSANIRLGDFYQNTNRNLNITGALTGGASVTLTTVNNLSNLTNATGQVLTLNPATSNSGYLGALSISPGNNVNFASANALIGGTTTINTSATQMGGIGIGFDVAPGSLNFTNVVTAATNGGVFGVNTILGTGTVYDMSTLGGGGMYLGSQTTGSYTASTLGADAGIYRLGGGTGTLTVTSGALAGANALTAGDARANGNGTVVLAGENTFTGGISVNNGVLSAGTLNSVVGGTASSNLGAPTSVANGTIHLGSGTVGATLRYTGAGEKSDRVINMAGTTGGATLENVGTGKVNFSSDLTFTGTGAKNLTLQGTALGEISGKVASTDVTIVKNGTGTWLLSGTGNSVKTVNFTGGTLDIGANGLTVSNSGSSTLQATSGTSVISATGNGVLKLSNSNSTNGADNGAATNAMLIINAKLGTVNSGAPFEIYNATGSTGIVVLNGENQLTGQIYINSSVLQVSNIAGALGTSSTIHVGSGSNTGNTFRYTGTGETTAKVIDLGASTGSATLDNAGTGTLRFTSNFTATGGGIKTLTLQGSTSGVGEIAGAIVNNSGTNTTSVLKTGTGTWSLSGANSYTGSTTVNGGVLRLDFANATPAANIVNLNSALVLGGGALEIAGKSGTSNSQTFASTTLNGFGSTVNLANGASDNPITLALGAFTRSAAGSTVDFVNPAGSGTNLNQVTTTSSNNAAGILGGYATVNGSDWATVSGGNIVAYSGYTAMAASGGSATANAKLDGALTLTGAATANSLKITATAASQSLALGANNLNLSGTGGAGGLLFAGGTSNAYTISGTGVVSAGAEELIVTTAGSSSALTISAVIGGSGGLTKAGAGTLTLTGTNTFTGNININGGTLAINGPGGTTDPRGLGATGARLITLNGGTFKVNSSAFNPNQNTKNFVIGGGGGTFEIASGATMTLDDGNTNAGSGTTAGAAQLQGTGTLTKAGAGTLQLGYSGQFGQVSGGNGFIGFTGNLVIAGGTVQAGNNNALGTNLGSTTVLAGGALDFYSAASTNNEPIVLNGTGPSGGGALVNTSANLITLNGPVALGSASSVGGNGAGGLTLNGPITNASASSSFTKSGTGTVTVGGDMALVAGSAVNVNAGTLALTTSGSISGNVTATVAAGASLNISAFGNTGYNVDAGQTFANNGSIVGNLKLEGILSGTGSVTGTIEALAGGTISTGNGSTAGVLTAGSGLTMQSNSTLALDLGVTLAGGSDQIAITSGSVALGGNLAIAMLPSFAGNIGDVFTIILNGGSSALTGYFSNATPNGSNIGTLTLGNGYEFSVNYGANADNGGVANDVTLTLAAVPEPSAVMALLGGFATLLGFRRRRAK